MLIVNVVEDTRITSTQAHCLGFIIPKISNVSFLPKLKPLYIVVKIAAEEVRFELTTQLPGFHFSRVVP